MKEVKFNANSNNMFVTENYVGEDIHEKVNRLLTTEEAITDDLNGQKIYTKRKDGVLQQFNVRADKWDIALEARDNINKTKIARAKELTEKLEPTEEKENAE